MSTIALNNRAYVTGNNKKGSLKERIKNYFEENAGTICSGLLMMNGNANALDLYRLLKK